MSLFLAIINILSAKGYKMKQNKQRQTRCMQNCSNACSDYQTVSAILGVALPEAREREREWERTQCESRSAYACVCVLCVIVFYDGIQTLQQASLPDSFVTLSSPAVCRERRRRQAWRVERVQSEAERRVASGIKRKQKKKEGKNNHRKNNTKKLTDWLTERTNERTKERTKKGTRQGTNERTKEATRSSVTKRRAQKLCKRRLVAAATLLHTGCVLFISVSICLNNFHAFNSTHKQQQQQLKQWQQ